MASNVTPGKKLELQVLIEKDGEKRTVIDFAEFGSRLLPIYEDDSGKSRKALRFSNAFLDVEGINVPEYAYFPPGYDIVRRESPTGLVDLRFFDIKIYFSPHTDVPVWDSKNPRNLLHVFGWFVENKFIAHKLFSGNRLKNPSYQTVHIPESDKGIVGIPAVFAFEKGVAIPVNPNRERLDLFALPPKEERANQFNHLKRNDLRLALRFIACSGSVEWFENIAEQKGRHRFVMKDLRNDLLLEAAKKGRSELVLYLLDAGANPRINSVREALTLYSNGELKLDIIDKSLLSNCIGYGHTELFVRCYEWLTENGVRNKRIDRLFEKALQNRNYRAANWLQRKGATLHSTWHTNVRFYVFRCLEAGEIELCKWICESTSRKISTMADVDGATPMHKVAPHADAEELEWLLEEGVPLNSRDARGLTPLMIAAGYNNIPAVCWLVENGSNINLENNKGHTPLQISIVKQKSETAACLIDYGADVNRIGPFGVTPLMQAILFRDQEIADAIISKGGFWNFESEYLDGTLDIAISMDYSKAIEMAIDQGLDENYIIFGKWPIPWLSKYYKSKNVSGLFEEIEPIEGRVIGSNYRALPVSDYEDSGVDSFEFSTDLPSRVAIRCLVDPDGKARLAMVESEIARFRENQIRKIVTSFSFNRSVAVETHLWIQVEFDLLMDNFELGFPRDINIKTIREIPDSSLPENLISSSKNTRDRN